MPFHLFRTGYHPANNPKSAGGPETIMVGEIEADSLEDAVEQALMAGITSFEGQRVWAEELSG